MNEADGTRSPRLVLDTNVFIAAGFNPGSHSAHILDCVREGRWRMVWNEATRRETLRILRRIPPLSGAGFSALFRPEDEFTGPTHPERYGQVADPDDRKFAALAAAAGATLVTNDDDLLSVRRELDVPVLTPRELVASA